MEFNKQHIEDTMEIRNKKEIETNMNGLRATFDSILTCATKGIALRGHGDKKNTSNLGIWIILSPDLTTVPFRSFLQRNLQGFRTKLSI